MFRLNLFTFTIAGLKYRESAIKTSPITSTQSFGIHLASRAVIIQLDIYFSSQTNKKVSTDRNI